MILHGHPFSANTHRVRILLSLVGQAFEDRPIDLQRGEHLAPGFAALNEHRKVPVLEDGQLVVRESYAILIYLARRAGDEAGRRLWPDDPAQQAQVAAWLFFTANDLHNSIGLARNEFSFGIPSSGDFAAARAHGALATLERRLETTPWLEFRRLTLADISAYPFAAVAPEAGVALTDYPAVAAWIDRLEALPGFPPMPRLPTPTGVGA